MSSFSNNEEKQANSAASASRTSPPAHKTRCRAFMSGTFPSKQAAIEKKPCSSAFSAKAFLASSSSIVCRESSGAVSSRTPSAAAKEANAFAKDFISYRWKKACNSSLLGFIAYESGANSKGMSQRIVAKSLDRKAFSLFDMRFSLSFLPEISAKRS